MTRFAWIRFSICWMDWIELRNMRSEVGRKVYVRGRWIHKLTILVFDAWGRPPSGFFSGNLIDLGNFDQCLDYSHQPRLSNLTSIRGQYCLVTIRPNPGIVQSQRSTFQNLDLRMMPGTRSSSIFRLSLGVCLPAACSPQTVHTQLENVLNMFNLTTNGYNQADFCHVQEPVHFNTADWCALYVFIGVCSYRHIRWLTLIYYLFCFFSNWRIFFGAVGMLMILSTMYEVYTQYYQSK
jgi:Nose resistant-to-fluoxetine protein, N-terminal domain